MNPFQKLFEMGYTRIVPIVPPGVELSERSGMFKRLQAGDDARGKAPGVKWPDGRWSGFDWIPHVADARDCVRWHEMGAGVGIKTGPQDDGTWLIGVDADTMDARCAAIISGVIRKRFGLVPTRIGRAPKALYVVRVDGPLKYARVEFNPGSEKNERVELLSEGRQFVAWGVHPVTMEPYQWAEKLTPFADLPVLPASVLA